MEHILKLDDDGLSKLEKLFENIANNNTLLLLGAGASITNKKYLSQQIIEYYEAKLGRQFNIDDLTKLIDVLEVEPFFNRKDFDQYVHDLLKTLTVTDTHKILVSIPWKQIITTNYDLLVEQAFDNIKNTSDYRNNDIIPIRTVQEYNSLLASNEIRYIKLHGCMSDKSKYPFLFSTQDFKKAKGFYKTVLSSLKNPSHKINFLSIGYSYSDAFAFSFLDTLDNQGFRDRRILYNLDPYVNESMLNFFASKKIFVIKLTCEEFFKQYKIWEEKNIDEKLKTTKRLSIKNHKNSEVSVSGKLLNNIKYSLEQLNSTYSGSFVSIKDFYSGEEPNYNIILKNYDVIKSELIKDTSGKIIKIINNGRATSLLPICFLTGTFGTGKTTITYRVINDLLDKSNLDIVAFEVKDIDYLKISDIVELISSIKPQYFLLYFDKVELDSVFKSMFSLRAELSSKQISETNIFFLASIRVNIFEKYKKFDYKNLHEINIDKQLTQGEIIEFIERLKECSLLNYRDEHEKKAIVEKVKKEYESDSFLSLVQLVTKGKHIDDLRDAYYELSEDCRKAFIYTSMLHRFNIQMPSSLLRTLVSNDWEEFKKNVIDKEGKGLLFQEVIKARDLEPDLYFKTKHPLIADLLVKQILKPSDILRSYKAILQNISQSPKLSRLTINLLKALSNNKDFTSDYINTLFDNAFTNLNEDPYFLLNYCINLQHRNNKESLFRSRELLMIAEGLLEKRNDKFIHRRAVVAFEIAKFYYREEKKELNLCLKYLAEAKDFFDIKQLLDPCSSYSYVDYLNCLIWELEKINTDTEDELRLKIHIEEQFETALSTITEGTNKVLEIKTKYIENFRKVSNNLDYLKQLDDMYEDDNLRPYACILKYNYFFEKSDSEICLALVDEMMEYLDIQEVVKFLFRYHSHKLNYTDNRMDFFEVVKKANNIEEIKSLNYNYFMFIAESYNENFEYAQSFLKNIRDTFSHLNPDYKQIWNEADSDEPRLFNGTITTNKYGYFVFRSLELQNKFYLKKGSLTKIKNNDKVKANLHFYLNGIRAEIIDKND